MTSVVPGLKYQANPVHTATGGSALTRNQVVGLLVLLLLLLLPHFLPLRLW